MRNNESNTSLDTEVFPPDILTDQAITAGREKSSDRMIIHYMQPHAPFIGSALQRGYLYDYEQSPYAYLKDGGEFDKVWESYLDNLRFALDEIERLLENIDAESVVITADHGELYGEWNLYSHIYGIPHTKLRTVPWVETTATDSHTSTPEEQAEKYETLSNDEVDVEDRLTALGYK